MPKGISTISMDTINAHEFAGYLHGLAMTAKTDRHIAPVIKYTHALMSEEFDAYMAAIAPGQPDRYHHVYDWGMLGMQSGQLWKNVLRGRGSKRVVSFEWLPSKRTVPIPDIPEGPGGKQLKEIHVFVWKAPVMEYKFDVVIKPKRGEFLAIPTGDPDQPLFFTRQWVHNSNPGGEATTGAFTSSFSDWWGGFGAAGVMDEKLQRTLEDDLGRTPLENVSRKWRKPRPKSFKMSFVGAQQAFSTGRRMAQRELEKRRTKYINAAIRRERNG